MKTRVSFFFAVLLFWFYATLGLSATGVIYSNFGPGMTFDDNPYNGWAINGDLGSGRTDNAISQQFTPASTYTFASAQVALTLIGGPDRVSVFLQADANGFPGPVLEQFNVSGLTNVPTIVTATSVQHTELQGGTPYWLTVWADGPGVVAGWNWNSIGDNSTESNFAIAHQTDSPTGPWALGLGFTRSAFQINGDGEGPVTSNLSAAPNPVAANTAIALTATVDDSTTGGSTIATAEYSLDDGSPVSMNAQDGAFDAVKEDVEATIPAFTAVGVHEVCVVGTDAASNIGPAGCILLVVFDPTAGFVTGGGWIDSPIGAYVPDPSLTGRANFGFVARYQKGATVPTGQTEFQYRVADLNFRSTSYEWLVVAGPKARFKGSGTINGAGDYGFMLTAIDGQLNGGGGVDKFRFKIWDRATDTLVYDNQQGDSDIADPTTVIGDGNIVIKQK